MSTTAFDLLRAIRDLPRRPGLGQTDKAVLLALALRCDEQGRCYPSCARIAADLWVSRRAVQSALPRLEAAGLIAIERRLSPTGTKERDSNWYTVTVGPRVPEVVNDVHHLVNDVHQVRHDVHGGGERRAPGVVNDVHQGGERRAQEVPIEVPKGSAQVRTQTPLPLPGAPGDSAESPSASAVRQVFDHWAEARAKLTGCAVSTLKLTADRRRKVQARLREGYTVEQLQQAVSGMLATPFNLEKGFTDLELAMRDASHVDRYMAGPPKGEPTEAEKGMARMARLSEPLSEIEKARMRRLRGGDWKQRDPQGIDGWRQKQDRMVALYGDGYMEDPAAVDPGPAGFEAALAAKQAKDAPASPQVAQAAAAATLALLGQANGGAKA